MTNFEELELKILRDSIDKAEEREKRKKNGPEIQDIINIVEDFIRKKKLICYGGTAINNILPQEDQFYDRDLEIPDYDFFSPNALNDAKELADIYAKKYDEVEAKAGIHFGTYKVFVNYIPVADITYMNIELFKAIEKDSISVGGILYTPPDYLRMSMYLELSRPEGDVSRWEKVLKRLILLNKNYPLKGKDCLNMNFQRGFDLENKDKETKIYNIVKETLIAQGVVFFGSLAQEIYSSYMPKKIRRRVKQKNPDFDVLALKPEYTATVIKEKLEYNNFNNISISRKEGIGEIIAPHYEVLYGKETLCFVYEPLACHSYNVITIDNRKIKIATIDTMLSFYLAFLYSNRPYYDTRRILCMAEFLFKVQQKNRLSQKGVLRRFSINCYGDQASLEDIREEKTKMYEKLMKDKKSKDYEKWFLRYIPYNDNKKTVNLNNKPQKKTKKVKKKSKKTKSVSLIESLFKVKIAKPKKIKTKSKKDSERFKIPLY